MRILVLRLFKEIWFWWLRERAFWRCILSLRCFFICSTVITGRGVIAGNFIAICGLVAIRCCVTCISSIARRATISRIVGCRIGVISFFSSSSRIGAIGVSGFFAGCYIALSRWVACILLHIDRGYVVGVVSGFGSGIWICFLLIVALDINRWVGWTIGTTVNIKSFVGFTFGISVGI